MILILSNNENDTETDSVCKYLLKKKTRFTRINIDDFIYKKSFVSEDFFSINDVKYTFDQFSVIWLRRCLTTYNQFNNQSEFDNKSNLDLNLFHQNEWNSFIRFFLKQFPKQSMINSIDGYFTDKIDQLIIAKKIGLSTPNSFFS